MTEMEELNAEISWTQKVIALAELQVKLLNRHLAEIQARYDHAQEKQMSLWVYKLRMRTLTVAGMKDVFVEFLEEKKEELEYLYEQLYWLDIGFPNSTEEEYDEEEDDDEDESFRILDLVQPSSSLHQSPEPHEEERSHEPDVFRVFLCTE